MDHTTLDFIYRVANESLLVTLVVCAPPIILSMIVGLSISLFQAVTQLQENTLTFVPKMIVIFGSLAAFGPWLGALMLKFTTMCFAEFPKYIH